MDESPVGRLWQWCSEADCTTTVARNRQWRSNGKVEKNITGEGTTCPYSENRHAFRIKNYVDEVGSHNITDTKKRCFQFSELVTGNIMCFFFDISFLYLSRSVLLLSVCVSLLGISQNRNLLCFSTTISVKVSNDLTRSVIAALPPLSKYKLSCWSACLPLSPQWRWTADHF